MDKEKHLFGIVELLNYDVIVPFICYMCGECCRRYTPLIQANVFPFIADHLNKTIGEIKIQHKNHYLSQNTNYPKDCLFLSKQNKCKIYPFRPEPCRLFPFTDFGTEGVNCPGHKEFKIIVNNLFKGRKYAAMWKSGNYKKDKLRAIPDREEPKIYQKLLKSNPSKLMSRKFIEMNKGYNDILKK